MPTAIDKNSSSLSEWISLSRIGEIKYIIIIEKVQEIVSFFCEIGVYMLKNIKK